jgi:hypothetical protein
MKKLVGLIAILAFVVAFVPAQQTPVSQAQE